MSFLPISINISGKRLLIVGGGTAAWHKLKNLVPFTDEITVVAPEFCEDVLAYQQVTFVRECYAAKHLDGIFLVYACTDSAEINARIRADATAREILCNRTDRSEVSDFHSPGIALSDEMTIAITSKKKEVKKMVRIRDEVREFICERERLLLEKEALKGKVFLVGFGPGNPDLLTIRGRQLLFQADTIFYDDLLDASALKQYKGEKIYVGKRRNNHSKEQTEINQVLLDAALQGKMVVRLKGGDPLIFGRGSEERFFLEEHGVKVEIVPGISAAVAAASYADIPLTHRGISSSVSFSTAHGKNSFHITKADTAVYYMGAAHIEAIARKYLDAGYPEDFPVGLVRNVSHPEQEIIRTTISAIAKGEITVQSPVISIFGKTVCYRNILSEALPAENGKADRS